MDSSRKKALKDAYKSRPVIGGVCCIRCSGNQRAFLQATIDVESYKNRFAFAMATKTCPDPSLRGEWEKYGNDAFSFSVLEEIKKKADQTDRDFRDDIQMLYALWMEKIQAEAAGKAAP